MEQTGSVVEIFCCYAHEDKELLDEFKKHLSPLQRQNVIRVWHDGDISAGTEWDREIKKHLNKANIILLLMSPDFIHSDYCYGTEMQHALKRHEQKEARVIPILLRPIRGWEKVPLGDVQLGQLQALPKDVNPVTSWADHDEVWKGVVEGIEEVINELLGKPSIPQLPVSYGSLPPQPAQKHVDQSSSTPSSGMDTPNALAQQKPQSPGEFYSCFISYSSNDQDIAQRLAEDLRNEGVHCWFAPHDMKIGDRIRSRIDESIRACDKLLLILSQNSIASQWVETEVETAFEQERRQKELVLFPIRLDETVMQTTQAWAADIRRTRHIGDFTRWKDQNSYRHAFTRLLHDLQADPLSGTMDTANRGTQESHSRISRRAAMMVVGGLISVATGGSIYIATRPSISTMQIPNGRILYHTASLSSFAVNALMWSPDGHSLVTADGDMTVSVIDASSGIRLATYRNHKENVNAVVWSPDGKEIASASTDKTVQIWTAKNARMRLVCQASVSVWVVAWSPDGAQIASAGKNNATQIWNARTGQSVSTYQGPINGIWEVAWSRDSQRIASGYTDGTIEIRSVRDGYLLLTYHGQSSDIYEIMWSPHSSAVVSASGDGTAQVWNSIDGRSLLTYKHHVGQVSAAEWSPDGTLIASADAAGVIQVWKPTTGETVHTYRGHTKIIRGITWSPDGKHLASGGDDGTIRIWDVQ